MERDRLLGLTPAPREPRRGPVCASAPARAVAACDGPLRVGPDEPAAAARSEPVVFAREIGYLERAVSHERAAAELSVSRETF